MNALTGEMTRILDLEQKLDDARNRLDQFEDEARCQKTRADGLANGSLARAL
jgi:hypothetical protein